jgi:uncharacterized protein (TIGR03437 family)
MRIALLFVLAASSHAARDYMGELGYRFEQVKPGEKYIAGGPGYRVSLSPGEVALTLPSAEIHMRFEGSRGDTHLSAEELLPGRTNHLEGIHPAQWRTGVPAYQRVRYREVYPGIDLVFYGTGKTLEYDYIVRPGGDPAAIRMRISGSASTRIDDGGDLVLRTGSQEVRWKRPVIYQPGKGGGPVDGRFALDRRGLVRFQLGAYDRGRELVIDPVLAYSTYLGGTGNDAIRAMAIDGSGNVFVAGITTTPDLPVTRGAVQSAYGGNTSALINGDAFVAKFNTTGTLVYLTYLGGSGDDFAAGIAVDTAGNAWVTGGTSSPNFPVTATAFQPRYGGAGGNQLMRMGDAFLSKIGPNGDTLLYSTYFGGSLDDFGSAVALDTSGNIYVTGATSSRDFPVQQPFQGTFRGAGGEQVFPRYGVVPFDAGDVFIAKFSATNQALVFSTYLGGSLDDQPTGIAVDSSGSAYVVGYTLSNDFPTTAGAYQRVNRGSNLAENIFWNFGDGFIVKLNPAGNQLVYSTLLGGTGDDFISSVAIDSTGAVYVTGATCSADFPTTTGVYQNRMKGPFSAPVADVLIGDAFLAKLNPQGTGLVFSTFLGGTGDDAGTAVRLDALGNIYVAGFTNSNDFPTTTDAVQRAFGGRGQQNQNQDYGDGFVAQFDATGAKLTYSTFFGGGADDEVMAMAIDSAGNAFIGGSTVSRNLTTKSAFQAAYGGSNFASRVQGDGFLAKISGFPTPPPVVAGPNVAGITNAASFSVGTVSPGMIFTMFGTGVGPESATGASLAANGTLSTLVAETQILFDGAAAPLVNVFASQSSGIVPYSVVGKATTQVVAVYKGQRSAPFTVQVADSVPGLFSLNFSGTGPGAIYNQDGTVNSATNPARRGDVVVLYGTGEGQTVPPGSDGLIATAVYPKPALTTTATIGGQPADVVYAGAVPFVVAGEFQINLRVPANITPGSQFVVVLFGQFRSQANLTVSVQ